VFFLAGNQDYDSPTVDPDWILYTKTDWNSDTYDECTPGYSPFNKQYDLGVGLVEDGSCRTDTPGWLSVEAFGRLQSEFGITLSGIYTIPVTFGEKVPHVIVGAPADDPKQWILGYEGVHLNLYWDPTDYDLNDLVFRIERRTGGAVQLKSDQALVPPDADAYYTAVNIAVYDKIPGGTCLDKTTLSYYLSIDNGANWVEVTAWDEIKEFSIDGSGNKVLGNDVSSWSPGDPEMTYRSRRMDFAGLGFSGRELIWKAEMTSDDDQCVPEIIDIELDANLAVNSLFSRSSPVVVANVLYSGSYETPAPSWTDQVNRGHLKATRIYDPSDPNMSAELELWDAGQVLNAKAPSARTIYFPDVAVTNVVDEVIATADGTTNTFSGTLAHYPVLATTLTISDQHETFEDKHTTVLEGNLGGTGTINRFTGEYTITFKDLPADGTTIKAGYSYYTTSSVLKPFTATNITNDMLGLDDSEIVNQGYVYDLNGDDDYTEGDGDWLVNWVRGYKDGVSTPKEWLSGISEPTPPKLSATATLPSRMPTSIGPALSSSDPWTARCTPLMPVSSVTGTTPKPAQDPTPLTKMAGATSFGKIAPVPTLPTAPTTEPVKSCGPLSRPTWCRALKIMSCRATTAPMWMPHRPWPMSISAAPGKPCCFRPKASAVTPSLPWMSPFPPLPPSYGNLPIRTCSAAGPHRR
jgi:hypothetical protein